MTLSDKRKYPITEKGEKWQEAGFYEEKDVKQFIKELNEKAQINITNIRDSMRFTTLLYKLAGDKLI